MAPLSAILRHVRRLASDGQPECPDAALLARFAHTRDEAAFEELLRRHGAMVWGVCSRLLRDRHAAEDAFQATFLVLARRAGSIRRPSSLGCWLYGVARRVAGKLRRPRPVADVNDVPVADPSLPPLERVSGRELVFLLDEELGRLPERLRAPLVLCYLEGRLREEAAKELGWTLSTVKQRLEDGRAVLRTRLARRGVGLPAALLSAALVENVGSAATPAGLTATTVRAATAFATGAAGVASPAVATADAVVRAMALSRLKWAAAVLVAAGTFAVGAGLAQRRAPADNAVAARPDDPQPPAAVQPAARVDQFGDPLPEQALARLGTCASGTTSG